MLSIITIACRQVHTYEGKATIISRHIDLSLRDSALIYGTVNSAAEESYPERFALVWIDGTNIKTGVDSIGSFNIKLKPGTYTIKCSLWGEEKDVEALNNLSVLPNEKIQVTFLLKEVIE
jgi:hypothetical protein